MKLAIIGSRVIEDLNLYVSVAHSYNIIYRILQKNARLAIQRTNSK